jgi:predicted ArsR family transcriptional regulator
MFLEVPASHGNRPKRWLQALRVVERSYPVALSAADVASAIGSSRRSCLGMLVMMNHCGYVKKIAIKGRGHGGTKHFWEITEKGRTRLKMAGLL